MLVCFLDLRLFRYCNGLYTILVAKCFHKTEPLLDSGTIGRATEVELNTLRRKLGFGCDPCFDYSTWREVPKKMDDSIEYPDELQEQKFIELLKQVNSETINEPHQVLEDIPRKNSNERRQKEQIRPSSAFKRCGRDDLQKRVAKNQGPAVGSYHPKAECLASLGRVKHPEPKVPDFKAYVTPKGGHDCENSMHDDQASHYVWGPGMTYVNMAKQMPRPDLLSFSPPNDPEAIDPRGVMDGHLHCARFGHFYRQPCFDFAKLCRKERIGPKGSVSPGEYEVKLELVKPSLRCHSFSCIPRASFLGSKRITDHLPDRSLSRDCPSLTKFGKLLSPPVRVPKFDRPMVPATGSCRVDPPMEESRTAACIQTNQWAWPSRESPKTLGISLNHDTIDTVLPSRPTSAPISRG